MISKPRQWSYRRRAPQNHMFEKNKYLPPLNTNKLTQGPGCPVSNVQRSYFSLVIRPKEKACEGNSSNVQPDPQLPFKKAAMLPVPMFPATWATAPLPGRSAPATPWLLSHNPFGPTAGASEPAALSALSQLSSCSRRAGGGGEATTSIPHAWLRSQAPRAEEATD